ncbi:MAG: right-handed parallel beta-helix repeat-containing protein [Lewinella sp.]|nr:right-handed parallel beta-helix repeat-containing protein [Lewinella sp.]
MKYLIIFLAISASTTTSPAERIYVQEGKDGNGSSWEQAFGDLQAALAAAEAGDEIWIAEGTYYPTQEADQREASFVIPSGVKVYGGFSGTEKHLADRQLTAHPTILSGEIGDPETEEDNVYSVVTFIQADPSTLLNGVVITKGTANGYDDGVARTTCGAAVFNDGEFGLSSPTITNCSFVYNYAREGAAIFNYANEGEASPIISDCKFLYNRSDFKGGAIFNDGNFGKSNPVIANCRFEGNESGYGAGVLNRALYGNCQPVITDCVFYDNFSLVRGSAVYNLQEGRGVVEPAIEGCVFAENGSTVGGEVDNTLNHRPGAEEPDSQGKSGLRLRASSQAAIGF